MLFRSARMQHILQRDIWVQILLELMKRGGWSREVIRDVRVTEGKSGEGRIKLSYTFIGALNLVTYREIAPLPQLAIHVRNLVVWRLIA